MTQYRVLWLLHFVSCYIKKFNHLFSCFFETDFSDSSLSTPGEKKKNSFQILHAPDNRCHGETWLSWLGVCFPQRVEVLTLCMILSFLIKPDVSVLCCKLKAYDYTGLWVWDFAQYTTQYKQRKERKPSDRFFNVYFVAQVTLWQVPTRSSSWASFQTTMDSS